MAYCKKCGTEIGENDKICPECGTSQDAQTSALMLTIGFIIIIIAVIWLYLSYSNTSIWGW
jgi:predicted nucleic acid-binding Zn ribbon protein